MKYYEIQNLYFENISCDDLQKVLLSNNDILEYYFILHDKDILDTGEIKKPHIHCFIGFEDYGRYTKEKVIEFFKDISSRVFPVRSIRCAIRYLVHKDDESKYQYNFDDIFTNDLDKVKKCLDDSKLKINDVLCIFIDKCYNFEIFGGTGIINFFKHYKMLNYCLLHYKSLCVVLDDIQSSYECNKNESNKKLFERSKN